MTDYDVKSRSESDAYRRQIMTYKVDPRAQKVKTAINIQG